MTASHPTEPNAMRTALGHKERFPPRRLSGGCGVEIGPWPTHGYDQLNECEREHSGQSAIIGLSQRSANIRSRKGVLESLLRHDHRLRWRLRPTRPARTSGRELIAGMSERELSDNIGSHSIGWPTRP